MEERQRLKMLGNFKALNMYKVINIRFFCMVQKDLKEGKEVLFTGTPCEVAGLKKYLRKEYDNLYTLDLICHGVPSSWIIKRILKGKEKLYSSQIIRTKISRESVWVEKSKIYIKFKNGRIYHAPIWVDNFYRLFTNNYILRDSCYACRFSSMERQGDITIGDFLESEKWKWDIWG